MVDPGRGRTSEDGTSSQVEEEDLTWEQQERGGCILWDTSASKAAAFVLLQNDVLAVLAQVSEWKASEGPVVLEDRRRAYVRYRIM